MIKITKHINLKIKIMKNKIILVLSLTVYSIISAQVGVNTTTPKATLDVTAKNSTGISSVPEGVIFPRVDRQKAQSMKGVETSTLIYVNDISTGTLEGTAVNIDQLGYYYFNGTEWVKLHRPDSIIAGTNFYNTDTGNIIVTTSNQTNGFSINSSPTFSVEETTLPTVMLDVIGRARVRTIDIAAGTNAVTPVYTDSNGTLLKSTSFSYGESRSAISDNLASGANGPLITDLTDGGVYKAVVSVGSGCLDTAIAEYYIVNLSGNYYYAINGLGGIISSASTTKSPIFNQVSRSVIATTWQGAPSCQDGGSPDAYNYTLTMPSPGTIDITNNGNVTKGYHIIVTRLY